jgi:hypothetical protein
MEQIYKPLNTATYGIIFLRVVQYAYPGIKTHLLEALRRNSTILQDLADEFRNLHSEFEIVSCFERIPTKYGIVSFPWSELFRVEITTVQIVEKSSALIGFQGERQIPMEGDHSRICKFTGPDDHLYVLVRSRIQDMARKAPDAVSIKFKIANAIRM